MALGFIQSNNNDIEPFVKYDAKAGRWFKVDRVQGVNGWETINTDITANATFIIDFQNIEVGWIHFSNQGPKYATVKVGQPQVARPDNDHRQGFRTHLYSDRNLDGKRAWSHNAKCVLTVIDALYEQYQVAPESKQGLLPVINCTGSTPIKTDGKDASGRPVSSTNYAPVFQIVQWVPSPFSGTAAQQQQAPVPPPVTVMTLPPAAPTTALF